MMYLSGRPLQAHHREPGGEAGQGIQGRPDDVVRGRGGLLEHGGPAGVRHDDDHDELGPAAAGRLSRAPCNTSPRRRRRCRRRGRRICRRFILAKAGATGGDVAGGGAGEPAEVCRGSEEESAVSARHLRAAYDQDFPSAGAVRLREGAVRGHLPDQPGRAGLHGRGEGRGVRRGGGDRAARQHDGRTRWAAPATTTASCRAPACTTTTRWRSAK